jgi:hypothetical protein
MRETLKQMFRVFEVESKHQQYKLDVFEKISESFPIKIEIMKSKNVESVMDNFRREGHVKGGGCVKFFRKWL